MNNTISTSTITSQPITANSRPTLSVVNDEAAGQVDTVQLSTSMRTYTPHYSFGKAEYSCGGFNGLMMRENLPTKDAYMLRDQMGIWVQGLCRETPDELKDAKPFKNLPDYTFGRIDVTATCGNKYMPIDWAIPADRVGNEKEAEKFCKKHHVPFLKK